MDTPSGTPAAAGSARESITLIGLLLLFVKLGAIGFGGGMAVIALMEREFVRKRSLLVAEEFVHGVGLGQILGSFAVNTAFFIGYRLFGLGAAMLSAIVFLAPSVALVIALSYFYFKYSSIPALQGMVAGLGPVVIALILGAGWFIGRKVLRTPAAVALGLAALAAGVMKVNAVWVLLAAAAIGIFFPARGDRAPEPEEERRPPGNMAIWLLPPLAPTAGLALIAVTFMNIGLVFFGGGFALIPVLNERLVASLGWLTSREFLDGVAISNLTPGPIAVLATFAGFRLAGIPGALVATAALFAPALILMAVVSRQYEKYHRDRRVRRILAGVNPAVAGLVVSAAALLAPSAMVTWRGWLACGMSLLLVGPLRWPPVLLLALGAVAGYAGLLP